MPGIARVVHAPMARTEELLREELASAGFGVLTEIDVAAVLAAKLGVQRPPMRILGACNPELAHRALDTDPAAALAIPCNVVLEDHHDGTAVTMADPREMMPGEEMAELADDATARLVHALDRAVARTVPAP